MHCIVGLGNPGVSYEHTRHNVGFLVIDALAAQIGITLRNKRALEAAIGEGLFEKTRVLLCKPQTFMNASGRTVQQLINTYPITPSELIIVYDDADLPFGDVRFKTSGSSAGHRGMQSLMAVLPIHTRLARIRIGIGRPDHPDIGLDEFVLQRWNNQEAERLPFLMKEAINYVRTWILDA